MRPVGQSVVNDHPSLSATHCSLSSEDAELLRREDLLPFLIAGGLIQGVAGHAWAQGLGQGPEWSQGEGGGKTTGGECAVGKARHQAERLMCADRPTR